MNVNLLLRHFRLTIACATLFSTILLAQSPTVICPGSPVSVNDISNNDPNFWNAANWWAPAISSHDLGESATQMDLLATNHCSTSGNLSFRYILSLDLDYNNTFETIIDSDSLPARNTVYYGNNTSHLFSGTARSFDTRPVNADQKWGFDLSVVPVGDSLNTRIIWKNNLGQSTNPEMPYGTHKIKWIVTDSCGNSSVCEYGLTVKDSKKPIVVCLNGLSVNLMNIQGGMVQLWASDFLQYTEDNYTPSEQLKIGIRRSGTGTGFPYNPDGTIQTGVQFTCPDLGTNLIELWSIDKDGNTDFCETYVLIQDNMGVCLGLPLPAGNISTEIGLGIANVSIDFNGMSNGLPWISVANYTNSAGDYNLFMNNPLPLANGVITPVLELDPLNGVNSWDLVLMSRHILGLDPLNSPYKIISGDANKSGTLTTFDIVEIRRLILGTYTELPNNGSWRFVDKTQTFADPLNPFAEVLRESLPINSWSNMSLDFIGCKIGDVDLTATPNFQGESEDRNYELAFLAITDKEVKAGEQITLHFKTPFEIEGLQMTLSAKGLALEKIMPGQGITSDNFGIPESNDDIKFTPAFTAAFETGQVEFDVQFTVLSDGLLSEMLAISNAITPSMAFEKNGQRRDVALRFEKAGATNDQPVLYQNAPNPWSTSTRIGFYQPVAGEAQITVTNQNGVEVFAAAHQYPIGYHQITLTREQIPVSGMYYVRLQTGGSTVVKKMVISGEW